MRLILKKEITNEQVTKLETEKTKGFLNAIAIGDCKIEQ